MTSVENSEAPKTPGLTRATSPGNRDKGQRSPEFVSAPVFRGPTVKTWTAIGIILDLIGLAIIFAVMTYYFIEFLDPSSLKSVLMEPMESLNASRSNVNSSFVDSSNNNNNQTQGNVTTTEIPADNVESVFNFSQDGVNQLEAFGKKTEEIVKKVCSSVDKSTLALVVTQKLTGLVLTAVIFILSVLALYLGVQKGNVCYLTFYIALQGLRVVALAAWFIYICINFSTASFFLDFFYLVLSSVFLAITVIFRSELVQHQNGIFILSQLHV